MKKYTVLIFAVLIAAACTEKVEALVYKNLDPTDIRDSVKVSPSDTSDTPDPSDFIEEPDDIHPDPTGIFDYSLLMKDHPRLIMTAQDEAEIREKITAGRFENKYLYKINKHIIDVADKEVESTSVISYKLDASGKRLLSQSNASLKRIFFCAYAYRMTGEKKYLDRCVETLNIVCNFPDWHPSHFLDTGEMSLAVAIGYDWLYYDLDYDTRVMVHDRLVRYGIAAGQNAGYHNTVGNWNSVCNAGITAAAIAIYDKDKDKAYTYIEKAISLNKTRMAGVYGNYGNYAEGYGYWEYGTSFQVCLMMQLQKAFGNTFGISDLPGLKKTPEFMLYMSSSNGGNFSYNDGGSANETALPAMWWFAQMQNKPEYLLNELRLFDSGKYDSNEYRLLPMLPTIIKDCKFTIQPGAKPASEIWYPEPSDFDGANHMPVVIVHTGWDFDEGDCYLGIKAGVSYESHSHLDGGSFVYESQGIRWSTDLQRPNYANAEVATAELNGSFWGYKQSDLRWNFIRMNNWGHSTLSFENNDGSVPGKLHPTDHYSYKGVTTLEEVFTNPEALGAKVDMTGHLKGQVAGCTRTFKLVNHKDLYIIDKITALDGQDAQMHWRMLTGTQIEKHDDHLLLSSKDGSKHLYIKTFPGSGSVVPQYGSWSAEHPDEWLPKMSFESSNSGYGVAGFYAVIPKGTTVTFTTVLSAELPENAELSENPAQNNSLTDTSVEALESDQTDSFVDL